ncbi:MAG TPA: hypothetical protein VJC18_03235 [bacterium]|nr:hypothetical protein [bacterium]
MPHQKKILLSVLGLCLFFSQHVSADDSILLIGRLTQQSYCQEKKWVDPHFEIGFVPIVLDTKTDVSAFTQKMVIATGTIDQSLPLKKLFIGSACDEEAQSRSDWVWGKGGSVRVLRAVPAWMRPKLKWNEFETSAIRVASINPFTGLQVRLEGTVVVVAFTNLTGRELKNLSLKAHYEGCYGKPMTAEQETIFPVVAAEKKVTTTFPQIYVNPEKLSTPLGDRSEHVISSLQIVSENKDVWFDFDAHAKSDLGLAVECLNDGQK